MPSISVNAPNVLYVEAKLDEPQRFLQQCDIIKKCNAEPLTAYKLFDLSPGFTKEDFKKAKMKMFLHFHPDKNDPTNFLNANAAFNVLKDAADYLYFFELSDRSDDSTVRNNPFYQKEMGVFSKSTSVPMQKSPAQQEYEQRLFTVYKANSMSPDDEEFFRDTITKHPSFLSLSLHKINGSNLFNVVCERDGSSSFFQWLTSQPYAEETLLKFNQSGWDCFCSAMHSDRRDCLQILFDTYGMEAFQASSIDYGLPSLVLDDEQLPTLFFMLNELGYVPNDKVGILLATDVNDANVDLFKKLHRTFVKRGWFIDYQELFSAAVKGGKLKILQMMHEEGMICPDTVQPIFNMTSDFDLFLAIHSLTEVIAFLKNTGYKNIVNLNSPACLIQSLNLDIISVHHCFQDQHGLIKDDMEHRFLAIMNKEKLSYQPEQLAYIQERWDSVWRTIAENPVTLGHNYAGKLGHLIESIARSPNPAPHLKKLYDIPVELLIGPFSNEDNYHTLRFESFTPLQLLIAVGEDTLAVRLIKSGFVDWRQEVQYTETLRSDGAYFSLNIPKRMSILDFARFFHLTKVEKAIQLCEAEAYLHKRTLEGNYKTQFSFFGFFHLHFGFSKQEKITAVRALISYLKDNIPIPESCRPALSQGELGKIVALSDAEYAVTQQTATRR